MRWRGLEILKNKAEVLQNLQLVDLILLKMDPNSLAVKVFDKHASEYQEKYMDVSLYSKSLNYFLSKLPEKAKLFELGCGPGNIARYILSQKPQLVLTATDLSPEMLKLAEKNNPGIKTALLDCRNLRNDKNFNDAIICSFCIPYLNPSETERVIQNISSKLNDNGLLYLSFIKGESETTELQVSKKGDKLYTHYYSAEFLTKILEANHFNILHTSEYLSYDAIHTDVVLVAEKTSALSE